MRISILVCLVLLFGGLSFVRAGEEIVDGIYLAGDEPQLLCSLSGFRTSDLPAIDEDAEIVAFAGDDVRFDVVLSEAAHKLGVRPGVLRLMRLNPPNQRSLGKIMSLSYQLDSVDKNIFHMKTRRALEAGTYHFCVEKPDFSTGKSEMTVKMIFFECSFEVVDYSKNTGEDQAAPPSD